MKTKKIPERTCVVTHEQCLKKDLLRIVRTKDLQVLVDVTGKMNGRGAYIKKDLSVLEKEKKNKILEHHLGVPISEDIYKEIEEIIKNN